MIRLVFLVATLVAGCDAGLCPNRCQERERQSTSDCEQAATHFPEGEGSRLQPKGLIISDFEGESLTLVHWQANCECFSDPPELHVVRADPTSVTEVEQLAPAEVDEEGNINAFLATDAVTPGSTWAVQAVDADGRRTDPFCAITEVKGP